MNNLQVSAILQKELVEHSKIFENVLKEGLDYNYNTSLKDYEVRINNALDLQLRATYLVSITSRMLHINKDKLKAGGCDVLKHKKDNETLQTWLDYYKSHVYTFSSRAKVLSEFSRLKQMANPDVYRQD